MVKLVLLVLFSTLCSVPVSSVSLHWEQNDPLLKEDYGIFVCKVDESKPKASFQWMLSSSRSEREITQNIDITSKQNGEVWQTNSTLKLKLKRTFKTIKCRAKIQGTAWTNFTSLRLDVKFPVSSVSLHQKNKGFLIENENGIFVCKVDESKPKASLQWILSENGSEREITQNIDITSKQNGKLWQTNSTLRLKLKRSFKAIKCRARIPGMFWTNFKSLSLDVKFPVPSVSLQEKKYFHWKKNNFLIEDNSEIFVCKVDESKPKASFQWILSENGSEREITENINITSKQNGKLWQTNSTLKLKLKRSFKTIKCRAKIQGMAWTNFTSLSLDVKYPPPGKPLITVNNSAICVGEPIRIRCEWKGGYPRAIVNLHCLSQIKRKNDSVTLAATVTREMSHYCLCQGWHVAKDVFTIYDLIIQYPPQKVVIHKTSYLKGNVSSLICDASGGYPAVYNYSWSPGNYPSKKEINISLNEVSSEELTCTVSHKCGGNNHQSYMIRASGVDIVGKIMAAVPFAGIIIMCCFIIYSARKKTAQNNRPLN